MCLCVCVRLPTVDISTEYLYMTCEDHVEGREGVGSYLQEDKWGTLAGYSILKAYKLFSRWLLRRKQSFCGKFSFFLFSGKILLASYVVYYVCYTMPLCISLVLLY